MKWLARAPRNTAARLLLLWGLGTGLAMYLGGGQVSGSTGPLSLSDQLFGSARAMLGERMVLEADRYFHQGVGHTSARAPINVWVMKWGDAISPKQHTTLTEGDLEEIIPWFRFATKMDPHNVDAFVTAAYWLVRGGQQERAQGLLAEALRKNPGEARIFLAMGHAYRLSGLVGAAEEAYEKGVAAWSLDPGENENEERIQMTELLLSWGALCEDRGDYAAAIRHYRSLAARFPEHTTILTRIATLERGERPGKNRFWGHAEGDAPCSHDHTEECAHDD